jgi:PAS domain S-box-containing protein
MATEFGQEKHLAPQFPLNVLLVEDNPDDAELCLRVLRKAQFDIQADIVKTQDEFAERLRTATYDVILADYNLGSWTGMDALKLLYKEKPDIPLILVTGALGDQAAVECVKSGVSDYILKDRMERLPFAIVRAIEEKALLNERRRAEHLLEESETKFRLITEAIPVAVFIEQDSQCCYANRAAARITGYNHQELLGMSFYQLIPSDSRKASAERLTKSLRDGKSSSSCEEARILTKKCEERWLDVTVATFQIRGRVAVLFTALDITDRKRQEDGVRYLVE